MNYRERVSSPLFFLLTVLCAAGAHGQAGNLWITDASGNTCIATSPGTPTTVFVRATFSVQDIAGMEFRIAGLPSDWIVSVTPGPLVFFHLGDVFSNGANLATETCGLGEALLYEVRIVPMNSDPATLSVLAHMFPGNPQAPCPRLVLGCGPIDGWVCVEAGARAILSGEGDCEISVTNQSWTTVKKLYE